MSPRYFTGDVVDYYARFRRGFPPPVVDEVVRALELTSTDLVVDLGCGTGQLTLPLSQRVRAVIGVDPEPDMLARARAAAAGQTGVSWVLGAERDLPALHAILGDESVGAITIATAIHLMEHERLFQDALPLLRPGGALAIIANGLPLWRYDTDWSRTADRFLAEWFQTSSSGHCGTDVDSRAGYRAALTDAGYEVTESIVEYSAELSVEELTGNIFSALGGNLPAPAERLAFAEGLRQALHPQVRFTEPVRVATLIGRRP